MKAIFYSIVALAITQGYCQDVQLAFRIKEKDLIPEGIAWDRETDSYYIGSIHKNKIVRVDSRGTVSDFISSGKDGLKQVLGMHIDKQSRLWACNNEGGSKPGGRAQVHVYDVKSKELLHVFDLAEANVVHLFNDVIVLDSGLAYVSDSDNSAVYQLDLKRKTIELFIQSDQLRYCNGIAASQDQTNLIVSTARGIQIINLETKDIRRLAMDYLSIADGLYYHKNSLIAIQNVFFPVSIARYELNESNDAVVEESLLLVDHPAFSIPTTGVIVDDWFYFIANSQLNQLDVDKIVDPTRLKEVEIWKLKIN